MCKLQFTFVSRKLGRCGSPPAGITLSTVAEARNQTVTDETRKQCAELDRLGWYHSIELPDGQVLPGLQSLDQLRARLAQFPIPADLTGKRVLDIGAWDGWFSFEMERRGARVVAVDSTKHPRFLVARERLGSQVEYHIADVCQLSAKELGYFDIVLFLGVLYHLKHPLLALEKVCELTKEMACVESFVTDEEGSPEAAVPLMEFYETTELRGQFDNWVGPNTACLLAFCRTAGFARVRRESVIAGRAHVTCYRQWPEIQPTEPGPVLTSVENSVTGDPSFSTTADDYAAFWFKSGRVDIHCENAFPEIGPYGSRPVHVHSTGGDGWHLDCKLPPGLTPGWHEARLRIGASQVSNSIRVAIDVAGGERPSGARAPASAKVRIALVTDGKTWERYRVRVGPGGCVSLWVSGLPEESGRRDVRVRLNGIDLGAAFVSAPDHEGLRQVNALLPSGLEAGAASITLGFRDIDSEPVEIELIGGSDPL